MAAILPGHHVDPATDAISITPVPVSDVVDVNIIVEHNNLGISLQDYADNIANGSATQRLSPDEFVGMFAPKDTDIAAVAEFAESYNLTVRKVYANSATVKLRGTAGDYNRAFGVELLNITTDSRTYVSYEGDISIPDNLAGIVKFVLGLDNSAELTFNSVDLEPSNNTLFPVAPLTPVQLATAYDFPVSAGSGQAIGIIALGGGYTQQNLTSTFGRFNMPVPRVVDVPVGRPNNPGDSFTAAVKEAMLDIYCAGGAAPEATIVMYFAPNTFAGFYNAVAAALYDQRNSPSVISISWGTTESSSRYLDTLFQAAIIMGITVTTATGDFGAKALLNAPNLTVQYPSTSPYVLACGGTRLAVDADNQITDEVTWNSGTVGSAGGISRFAALPQWQAGLTARLNPSGADIAITQRAIPDIAGNSDPASGYQFYYGVNNIDTRVGGTSAAAPLFAGMIARINSITRRRSGFLNPLIYSNTQAFRDVTEGNNSCPFTVPGYQATTGWDACTGVGSPIGTAILNILNKIRYYPNVLVGTRPLSGQMYPRILINN
jgi:kumamolisin